MNNQIIKTVMEFDSTLELMRQKGSVKWTNFFSNESEIVEALKQIPIVDESYLFNGYSPVYSGYMYIHSFAKQIQNGKNLSDSQMRQAKRLAAEIKKSYLIRNMW